jgi:hypothetical protein
VVEHLWDKYAVSSRELEIRRAETLKTLDGFLGRAGVFEGGSMKKPLPGEKTVMKRYVDLLADIKTKTRSQLRNYPRPPCPTNECGGRANGSAFAEKCRRKRRRKYSQKSVIIAM